jgi:hypothetical protein
MKKIGKWVLPVTVGVIAVLRADGAAAMDLDWTGDFRTEAHWVKNYPLDSGNADSGGYAIPEGDKDPAQFQTLFMRLKPRVLVNDNVSIRSELWMGTPSGGFFGDAGGSGAASPTHLRTYDSTFSGGGQLSAQRYWLEVLTDVGNLQAGRAPMDWGLGVVWNGGNGLWDRYASTGDTVRMVSKFGAFSVIPSSTKYTFGNSLAGAQAVSDYSLAMRYESVDEGFDGGVNFIRRIGRTGNTVYTGGPASSGGFNYTTWDLYARKKVGKVEIAVEAPIIKGEVAGAEYTGFAIAGEGRYEMSDAWQFSLKAGRVPGQAPNEADSYTAIFFNPNYRLGTILFGYGLQNLGSTTSSEAFYSPVTNANYVQVGGQYSSGKWQFRGSWLMAGAAETAAATGNYFNQWSRSVENNTSGVAQEASYGSEFDLGASMQWDDHLEFRADGAIFLPGAFYEFNDASATQNDTGTVLAVVLGVGVRF